MAPCTLLLVIGLLLAVPTAVHSTAIRVPTEQPTIQAGLDAAAVGDTVLVAPGLYGGAGNRDITFRGRDLVLASEGGAEVTTIDTQRWRGVVFEGGETESAVVDGFKFLHCAGWPGGAFAFFRCSPTIKRCRIQECGGTGTFESHPKLQECVFDHNVSSEGGGAITVRWSSSMRMERCTFIANSNHTFNHGGAINVEGACAATIIDCVIVGNQSAYKGGAIYVAGGGSASVVGCTITDNCAGVAGGLFVDGTLTLDRSIVTFNHEYSAGSGTGTISATCTDVFGNEGGDWVDGLAGQGGQAGNISLDPAFCDRRPPTWECPTILNHDYGRLTLRIESPCAPEHSGGCGLIGALPVACGPVSVEARTWGEIKARFSVPR